MQNWMEVRITQAGFTFLEVMVSVAIIGVAFVTLIGSQSQSVSVATISRFNVMASLLAQQKLAELESSNFDELFSDEGEFDENYQEYRWKSEVNTLSEDDTGIEGTGDMLKSVDLMVSFGENEQMTYHVRSIVMQQVTE